MSCQFEKGGRVVSREDGMEFKDKIVFYCSREVKCKLGRDSLHGFDNSYIMF